MDNRKVSGSIRMGFRKMSRHLSRPHNLIGKKNITKIRMDVGIWVSFQQISDVFHQGNVPERRGSAGQV